MTKYAELRFPATVHFYKRPIQTFPASEFDITYDHTTSIVTVTGRSDPDSKGIADFRGVTRCFPFNSVESLTPFPDTPAASTKTTVTKK